MPMASPLEVVIVHSSDLHLGVDDSFSDHDRLAALPKVLTAANKVGADVVVLAGDTFDEPRDPHRLIGSWLIHSEDLVATGADYVALGHWNQATAVGDGRVIAHYSGSPEYVGTVNVVRMWGNGQVEVAQAPLNGFAK